MSQTPMCRRQKHNRLAVRWKYPDTGLIPATTVNPDKRNEPFMDTRTTPSAQRGMALFREPDGSSLAGDTVPCAEVEGHLPGQGHGDRGAPRPVRGLHQEARRVHRRRQGHRRALPSGFRVPEVDSEAGHRQRHLIYRACHGAYSGLLHLRHTGRHPVRHRFRRGSRHCWGHFFRHLWGHFWGHILYR